MPNTPPTGAATRNRMFAVRRRGTQAGVVTASVKSTAQDRNNMEAGSTAGKPG